MMPRRKVSNQGGPQRPQSNFVLFRFTDTAVEPGKQYQYRVKLRLANPNFGVTERYLVNPESAKPKVVYSPWSEPTAVVTVPRDVEVFAGPVVKPSSKDPLMRTMINRLDRDRGLKLVAEQTFRRGDIMSIHTTIQPDDSTAIATPTAIDAQLNADAVVVDIEGGKPLKGRNSSTSPGELVLLQGDGSLVLRDEFEDESTYRLHFPEEGTEKASDPRTDPAPAEGKRFAAREAAQRRGSETQGQRCQGGAVSSRGAGLRCRGV